LLKRTEFYNVGFYFFIDYIFGAFQGGRVAEGEVENISLDISAYERLT